MKKIFLHLGPGGNSDIDQQFLKDKSIEFYAYSLVIPNEENYINRLISELETHLEKELKSKELHLIVHSFSAQIVLSLDQEILNKVSKLTFLAPTFNFKQQVYIFLSHMIKKFNDNELSNILPKDVEELEVPTFWNIFAIVSKKYPNYILEYFSEENNAQTFLAAAAKSRPLDENSFIKGSSELINSFKYFNSKNFPKNTKIYIGKDDPYFNADFISKIRELFDHTKVLELENCGHYPHIESNLDF